MLDFDFLPPEYHQRRTQRHAKPWRHVVVVAALLTVAGLASAQRVQRKRLDTELAAVVPLYEKLVADRKELADLQQRLGLLRHDAELLAYLKHPWPKTRVLASVLSLLPDGIKLEQCQAAREIVSSGNGLTEGNRPRGSADQKDASKTPAERDLQRLREEYDSTRTVVRFSGISDNAATLHDYVARLGRNRLFERVELESLETVGSSESERCRFRAILVIRAGYGQPGAPTVAEGFRGPEQGPVEQQSIRSAASPSAAASLQPTGHQASGNKQQQPVAVPT